MKKIALAAEANEFAVERIYCSSDPASLDGIVIPALSFAMIDGTAPHVIEPAYPLATETIINTCDYINSALIEKERDRIISLTDEKKLLFSRGESLLKAATALDNVRYDILSKSYNSAKGFKYCKNIILKHSKTAPQGETTQRSCFSFGKDGFASLTAFPETAHKHLITEKFSPFILGTLRLLATEYKIPAIYSPTPLNPQQIGAVYFPASKTLFASSAYFPKEESMSEERFSIPDVLKANKEKIKFLSKTQSLILSEAQKYLAEAMDKHKQLENIYKSALNTDGLNCLAESIIIALMDE
jgi:hypothetical protein